MFVEMSVWKDHLNQHFDSYYDKAEKLCNETVLSRPPPKDGVYCPAVLDHWGTCINYTKAGTIVFLPCPDLGIFNSQAKSYRRCEANGTWQIVTNGRSWTNNSACTQNATVPDDTLDDKIISYVYLFIAGASLSLVLLIISLIIFYGFRQLRCDRVTIHKNLFISYIFTAITWIAYYRFVALDGDVIFYNPVWCQLLHVLAQYFTTTNFSWMFCEGLYLHIIMAHALRTGKKLIKCLVIGGWGVPLLLTVVYGAVRATATRYAYMSCWIHDDVLQWIIAAPILASVLINICILVNLVRLLMTKLRQIPDAPQSRKAAKATLILVPLFGLQFLVFPVRPDKDAAFHMIYLHFMALLMSLQGTMVSIIFCFCNGEVRSLLRRKWHQHRLMSGHARKNTGFTSSTYVDGYSVVDTTRDGTFHRSKVVPDNSQKIMETVEMKAHPLPTTPLVDKDNSGDIVNLNNSDDCSA